MLPLNRLPVNMDVIDMEVLEVDSVVRLGYREIVIVLGVLQVTSDEFVIRHNEHWSSWKLTPISIQMQSNVWRVS